MERNEHVLSMPQVIKASGRSSSTASLPPATMSPAGLSYRVWRRLSLQPSTLLKALPSLSANRKRLYQKWLIFLQESHLNRQALEAVGIHSSHDDHNDSVKGKGIALGLTERQIRQAFSIADGYEHEENSSTSASLSSPSSIILADFSLVFSM